MSLRVGAEGAIVAINFVGDKLTAELFICGVTEETLEAGTDDVEVT